MTKGRKVPPTVADNLGCLIRDARKHPPDPIYELVQAIVGSLVTKFGTSETECRALISTVVDTTELATRKEIDIMIGRARMAQEYADTAIADMPCTATTINHWEYKFCAMLTALSGYLHRPGNDGRLLYLYLFESAGLYKIGITQDVQQRIRSMQSGNPHSIVLIAYRIVAYAEANERNLHAHFQHCRRRGEWFALDADDVAKIKQWFITGIPTRIEK